MHVKVAPSVGDTLLAASCFGCMLVLFVLTHIEGGTACFYVSTFLYLPGSGQHDFCALWMDAAKRYAMTRLHTLCICIW